MGFILHDNVGGVVGQSAEHAAPGGEVWGSISAVATRSLGFGRCQYNVTG